MPGVGSPDVRLRVDIRPALIEDVSTMDRLLQGLADFLGEPEAYCPAPEVLKKYGFGADRLFNTMLAFEGPEPVGICVYFSEFSTWRGQPGVYIQDLYLTSSVRGSGLGPQLIEAVRHHALSVWRAEYVRLSANRSNLQAIQFYERLGFVIDQENLILKLYPPPSRK